MKTMPNFFEASGRIKDIMMPAPISRLKYVCNIPDMSRFTNTFEDIIDSGNLFKYEDYDYIHNGRVVNNLTECRNLYAKSDNGWEFLRRERIKDGRNINFVIGNHQEGWFKEILDNHPDLIVAIDHFIDEYKIDVWKVLVFKVDQDLRWHMDVDGYYGFRLFIGGHSDWKLKFREVKPEYKDKLREMTWAGQWNEVDAMVPEATFGEDIVYTAKDTGQAFLIDSMNYVHYFENPAPFYGVLVKGVI